MTVYETGSLLHEVIEKMRREAEAKVYIEGDYSEDFKW